MALDREHHFLDLNLAGGAHEAPHAEGAWEPAPASLSTEHDEYQIIFELAGCGMAQADPATLRLTRINRRLCQWLGYTPEEMVGADLRDFIHPEERETADRDVKRLLGGEFQEYAAERRYLRKSGEPLWVEISVTLLRDAAGRPQRVVTVFHDITERKQGESALRAVALFPEQNPEPVMRTTPEGRLIYANPPALAMLKRMGWPGGEALPEALTRLIAAAQLSGAAQKEELFDGERFMSIQCVPIAAEGYVNLYGRDVTERRRAEEALRESEAHAQRRLAEIQAIYHTAPVGLCILDPELRYVRINERLAGINGLPAQEHIGRTLREVVPSLADQAEPVFRRILETGEAVLGLELVGETAAQPGVTRTWSENYSPLRDAAGRIVGVSVVAEDITERRRAEQELVRRMEEIQTLMDVMPIGVLIAHDPECRRISGNPAAHKLLRIAPGANLSLSAPPEERPPYQPRREGREIAPEDLPLQRAARGARVEGVEISHTYDDGSTLWHYCTAAPLLDEQGRPRGAVGAFIDVTPIKLAGEALRRSEAQFRQLAEAVPQIVWILDGEGHGVYANGAWRNYFGKSLEEIEAAGWRVQHPDDQEMVARTSAEALSSGTPFEMKYRLRRFDGQYRWHLVRGVPMLDDSGKVIRWYGTSTDIDDIKRAAEELQAADRRKDEYLAMLAHELRNPLAPIMNAVEVLKLAGDSMELRGRQWGIIERQVAHMARLLDDLLDVARVTRGKIELRREPLALAEALRRAVELAQPGIASRRHTLEFTAPPETLCIEGDLDRMIQVVGNLLNNAAKYTPPGGRIWLSGGEENGEAVIRVRDSGIGLAPEALSRIFELFTQVQSSTSRLQGGLGIGLTMARSLVQMHGGAIEARSAGLGQGSEFIVRLPALAPEARRSGPPPREASAKDARPPRRILIVDDAADAAASMSELLSRWGHEVRLSHNGPEALAAAGAFQPEFVLLDIGLPDMDGFEVARRLRQNHPGSDMTLVAITGYGQASDRQRTREAGFDHHLVKPVDLRYLKELLRSERTA